MSEYEELKQIYDLVQAFNKDLTRMREKNNKALPGAYIQLFYCLN